MHRIVPTVCRALWWACLSALFVAPPANASTHELTADFDGDGHGDHVTFTLQEPSVVRVWLSTTQTTNVIRSSEPLRARLAAADLDGDHRAELFATDGSAGLHIWTKQATGFRAYRPTHRASPVCFSRSSHRASDPGRTPPVVSAGSESAPVPLSLVFSVHAGTATVSARRHAPRLERGPPSSPCLTPFAPRPPPLSAI